MAENHAADPYRNCERNCAHDLGEGVLIAELLGGDGPHPPGYMVVTLGPRAGPALYDDELLPHPARRAS